MATFTSSLGKRKNHRRHSGMSGPRPDRGALRKEEAKTRQDKYDALTPDQKLASLKEFNGNPSKKNGEAKKQVARLLATKNKS